MGSFATNPYASILKNSQSFSTPSVGNFQGTVAVGHNYGHPRPPLSPLWGSRTTKTITMNVKYRLEPLGIVSNPLTGLLSDGSIGNNVLLCRWIPDFGRQRDLAMHHKLKNQRVQAIRKRKRLEVNKPWFFFEPRQRKLKRLQRRAFLKVKKYEIYEKWEQRKIRRDYRRRRENPDRSFINTEDSWMANLSTSMNTTFREGSESPFQCPLWNCPGTRYSRRDKFIRDKYFGRVRNLQHSRLSNRSDKSRSPITIRPPSVV